ncbi:type II secretion system-associated lipoprotein [Leptospira selangorensis]|uniref:Type II secretion system-associated lipoprotein n=1 Tax=Leptospira selangorensis TaxID=2484982 RepID=A0A4R9FU65_9LEPT|nr:type II secretion system-associated lipoprotein [Leptospira selangorensis]TGK02456.1 type II secretion system-associated lipoprotein [Leptospira selangorensis]TGM11158.1 type II secretion system-associated lipoprotein [Leptospira selangorensis]TGM23089.1 type II secretion system-associated lipoprotein [Leptospira selangorensis]
MHEMVRFFAFLLALFTIQCGARLIKKEKLFEINEHYQDKIYSLKKDTKVSMTETFKKGMLVRIYVESTPSLVKVKCFPADQKREHAIGRLIAYQVNDDLDKKTISIEDLDKIVANELTEYKKKK